MDTLIRNTTKLLYVCFLFSSPPFYLCSSLSLFSPRSIVPVQFTSCVCACMYSHLIIEDFAGVSLHISCETSHNDVSVAGFCLMTHELLTLHVGFLIARAQRSHAFLLHMVITSSPTNAHDRIHDTPRKNGLTVGK